MDYFVNPVTGTAFQVERTILGVPATGRIGD